MKNGKWKEWMVVVVVIVAVSILGLDTAVKWLLVWSCLKYLWGLEV